MPTLTQDQLTNVIGFIEYKLSYIYSNRATALNPNSLPADVTQANQNALQALSDIQTLLNTIYNHFGLTRTNSIYNLTQLQGLGLA